MRILRTVRAMTAWSASLHREGVVIGLVPTMGALHAGHQALIKKARLSCDALVVSLFVNPRQFGLREDFSRYPRQLKSDAKLCRAGGVDVLFVPTAEEMYPHGFATSVAVEGLSRRWEGARRPGHFEGVATVVAKLSSLVRPRVAFFGQKDIQQAVLVRQMVEDLNLGARVVVCPTVRDNDGLALSSRNHYLTPAQRRAAPVLYAGLLAGQAAVLAGVDSGSRIARIMRDRIATEPLARVDYLSVCEPHNLEPLRRVTREAVLLGAIRLGQVRLIDNLLVRKKK